MPIIKAGSINLNYDIYGSGEPLLLIMGFGMPGIAWMPLLPMLQGFQCIYFDNRGTGNSDQPQDGYTVAEMAEDTSNLLLALGIEKARVYGVSMGGMIAQELALRHPAQVTKLVLGCTTSGGPNAVRPSEQTLQTLLEAMKLIATDTERGLDLLLPLTYPPDFLIAHPEIKQFAMLGLAAIAPTRPEIAERTLTGLALFDTYDRLPQLKCPVLIVHGDKDVLIPPANADILARRLSGAETIIVPNAGHNFWGADPMSVHQRIVAWLKQ